MNATSTRAMRGMSCISPAQSHSVRPAPLNAGPLWSALLAPARTRTHAASYPLVLFASVSIMSRTPLSPNSLTLIVCTHSLCANQPPRTRPTLILGTFVHRPGPHASSASASGDGGNGVRHAGEEGAGSAESSVSRTGWEGRRGPSPRAAWAS